MRRIVHLSDLHFGRDRPELAAPLIATVNQLSPDLIAVSGDLTQRAKTNEFADAAQLLAQLHAPKLVVPGNHDVPLWNLWQRLTRPLGRYNHWFGQDTEPMQELAGGVAVIGVNSVDPFAHQRGKMDRDRTKRVIRRLSQLPETVLKIVVMHHPFIHPPGSTKAPMPGARRAARAFSKAGADIILSGHLHHWSAASFELPGRRSLLFVQAGTGLSTRLRGEPNDFNLLLCAPGMAEVTRYVFDTEANSFVPTPKREFRDGPKGWYDCQPREVADQPGL